MRTLQLTCLLTLVGLTATPTTAQCTVKSVAFRTYGSGCQSMFAVPTIRGSFAASPCQIQVQIGALSGCCNTFLRNYIYAFGLTQTNVAVPALGLGCTLLAQPDVVVVLGSNTSGALNLTLPKGIGTGTVYMQSAAQYFTTIGLYYSVNLTQGLAITLQ